MRPLQCIEKECEIQIAVQHTSKPIWMTSSGVAADWKLSTEVDVDRTEHKRRYICPRRDFSSSNLTIYILPCFTINTFPSISVAKYSALIRVSKEGTSSFLLHCSREQ